MNIILMQLSRSELFKLDRVSRFVKSIRIAGKLSTEHSLALFSIGHHANYVYTQ